MIAKSLWLLSLHVMETPRVKTLGTTPGNGCGARWPKANLNVAWGYSPGGVGDTPSTTLFYPNAPFGWLTANLNLMCRFIRALFAPICRLRPIPPSGHGEVGFQPTIRR
jgi:hypothetical protein